MTAFTFNTGVPATNNDPSVDQPDMLSNNQSTNSILAVDHISFNSSGSGGVGASGGQHKQVTYNDKAVAPAMTDPLSIAYTADGLANTAHPQNYFKNSQGVFPLSALRAFGSFTTVAAPATPTLSNYHNVTATSHTTGDEYIFTLATNAVNGNNVIVIPFLNTSATITYTFVNPTLTLNVPLATASGRTINFIVIQI